MKAPAFQFYSADWLVDTQLMTLEEEGAYIRLLSYCWVMGSVPQDTESLQKLLKGTSSTVIDTVKKHFKNSRNGLVNKRLEKEKQKQKEWREKCSMGGINSGKQRRSEAKGSAKSSSSINGKGSATLQSSSSSLITTSVCNTEEPIYSSPEKTRVETASTTEQRKFQISTPQSEFEKFWQSWSEIRGTYNRNKAARQWLSVVTEENVEEVFRCTWSYLAGPGSDAQHGYNPENFLREQAPNFEARWPPANGRRRSVEEQELTKPVPITDLEREEMRDLEAQVRMELAQ